MHLPRYVAAPMVDYSERAFRLLCRQLSPGMLCFTPMLNAREMANDPAYCERHFDPLPSEREGLVAQLAGHDRADILYAARLCAPHVAAIDLNLGCPQEIARKGRYGAFLLELEPELACALVRDLHQEIDMPISVKVRLQPTLVQTISLCRRLQDAGAAAICIHARTRQMTHQLDGCGAASWSAITTIVEALEVPVIANGGIASLQDVEACICQTSAAAVMAAEALLENPALFCGNKLRSSGEYLDQAPLSPCTPPYLSRVRAHVRNDHAHTTWLLARKAMPLLLSIWAIARGTATACGAYAAGCARQHVPGNRCRAPASQRYRCGERTSS